MTFETRIRRIKRQLCWLHVFLDSSDRRNQQKTTAARVVSVRWVLMKWYNCMQLSSRDHSAGLELFSPAEVRSPMDFIQGLDPSKLVFGGVVSDPAFYIPLSWFSQALSFLLSLSSAPQYNLAIYLFGTYAQEQNEAIQSLKTVRYKYTCPQVLQHFTSRYSSLVF